MSATITYKLLNITSFRKEAHFQLNEGGTSVGKPFNGEESPVWRRPLDLRWSLGRSCEL